MYQSHLMIGLDDLEDLYSGHFVASYCCQYHQGNSLVFDCDCHHYFLLKKCKHINLHYTNKFLITPVISPAIPMEDPLATFDDWST